jgi:hypothetical protein
MTGLNLLIVKNLRIDFVKTLENLAFCATLATLRRSRQPTQGSMCLLSIGFQQTIMLGILTNTLQWI